MPPLSEVPLLRPCMEDLWCRRFVCRAPGRVSSLIQRRGEATHVAVATGQEVCSLTSFPPPPSSLVLRFPNSLLAAFNFDTLAFDTQTNSTKNAHVEISNPDERKARNEVAVYGARNLGPHLTSGLTAPLKFPAYSDTCAAYQCGSVSI
jgi:hypothetical protein